jgi:hypothetical protein
VILEKTDRYIEDLKRNKNGKKKKKSRNGSEIWVWYYEKFACEICPPKP